MKKPRVLIVEDDPDGRRSVAEAIGEAEVEVVTTERGEQGVELFRDEPFDAVLTDLVLPDIDGIEVLNRLQRLDRGVPVIIMTAYGSVSTSVQALKSGAYDYITKPLDLDELQSRVARAVETRRLRTEVAALQRSMRRRYSASAMVARSAAMREVLRQVEAVADTTATVLIRGESGTGKELVARALHVDGGRSGGPFVAVNCAAFAETLLESELFGHEKGAFTGATGRHKGAFERADGGTLFLDEIGDAPLAVQVKLLRVLEEREIIRLGGQEHFKVDVRLLAASNRDLESMIAEGGFREDLLYRLNVVGICVPPLRERRDDIRPLAERFLAAACEEHGRTVTSVAPEAMRLLQEHDWPGNVRELRNVIESAVVMSTSPVLGPQDLRIRPAAGAGTPPRLEVPAGITLAEIEREALVQTLTRLQGNRTLSAEALGLSRRTIQRKIQEYRLPF